MENDMNKPMVPPFVWIRGRPYLVVDWDLNVPPDSEVYLLLRPLSRREAVWLEQHQIERDWEA